MVDALGGDDLQEALHDLRVGEAGVAQDGAAGLEGLDDLVGLVAREGEARGAGVDFHRAAESLLRAGCHAGKEMVLVVEGGRREEGGVPVCFVEDDELLPTLREGDFLLGKAFDPVADYVDTCRVLSKSAPYPVQRWLAYPVRHWR